MNRELTITEQWTEHKENVEALAAKAREGAKRRHSELGGIDHGHSETYESDKRDT